MEAPEQQEAFQAVYIPKQTQPKPAHLQQGTMRVNVVSYPPLGQVTVVKTGKPATFNVLLEVDESRASDEWHVAVWFSSDDEWRQVDLKPAALTITSFDQPHEHDSVHLQFSGELPQQSITNFTIKFRSGSDWKWVRDNQGAQDGTIISRPTFEAQDLTDLVGDLNPAFQWSQVLSETPKTSVWSVTTSIDGADGIHSAFKTVKFGRPWKGDFLRWFALVRIWTPWLCPRQGRSHFQLDKDAVMCSFLNKQGQHLVVYAISGVEDVLTIIESDDVGGISLNIRNDRETQGKARIVVALGNEFELANAAAMYHARSIVMDLGKDNQQYEEEMKAIDEGVRVQWMENWFDGLTYCTWNGLGQRLTEEKVYKAVDILAQHKINITNLIIDDNWQDLDYRGEGQFQHGWSSFEADPETFPDGLRALTSNIRMKHPNIQHIAVWHALWGYWGGIDPTGKLAKEYKTVEAVRVDGKRRNLPLGGKVTLIAKEDVPKFYDDFYRFLSNSGVDAVKTDAQFMFDTLRDATDRRDLFNTYLDAWTVSSLKHFSIKAISCMSQTPQILYHSQLPSNRPAILVRNSDDFFPEVPSSHTWHVWTNAHNALMTQHLNLLPDWDMFQTVHDYSGFHAAARCVSGGPIYITDVPGQHDMNLIKQMTGRTTRGKTVIFRPSVVGKSLDQYIDYNDEVLLKIATYHGAAETGTPILGVFNTSPRPLSEILPLSRFPGVVDTQPYIIRSHTTVTITTSSVVKTSLPIRGYDILTAYPLRGFTYKSKDKEEDRTLWLAALGLTEKMTAAATIVNTSMTMNAHGKITVECALKALGVFGLYVSEIRDYTLNNFLVTLLGQVVPVEFVKLRNDVLEVDVEGAWDAMGLDAGWSNEVRVTVLVVPA